MDKTSYSINPLSFEDSEKPKLKAFRAPANLFALCFDSMKALPARYIIEQAEARSEVTEGTEIIESTSGTFGTGLALACLWRGYPLRLISDSAMDLNLLRRLRRYGADIDIVSDKPKPDGRYVERALSPELAAEMEALGARIIDRPRDPENGSYQQARFEYLQEELVGDAFWPNQYGNPDNPGSYAETAERLLERLGPIDCLVGTVGSGGSMCGLAATLQQAADLYVIGVDSMNSVTFGQLAGPRLLRGAGSNMVLPNVSHAMFDEIHWIDGALAFAAANLLNDEHGLFMGGTSGAAFLVARWYARQNPDARVAVVMPDAGYRYQETIYNPAYLATLGGWPVSIPQEPIPVRHPRDLQGPWMAFAWERRALADVIAMMP